MKHTVAVVTHAHVLQNFYTTWVRGVACQKQRLGPKLEGGLASNFKFGTQIGSGTSLPENNVLDQNWWGSGLGEHPKKIWDPLRVFATVEGSNFKFGTQIGFGTSLPENNVLDQNWRGSGPKEHPIPIFATVEASD